jgi:hypothetical protein
MSKESLIKVSPQLEKKALSILNVKSPLDSPDFDPTQYLNRLFPNGITRLLLYRTHISITITL